MVNIFLKLRPSILVALLVAATVFAGGCSSRFTNIAPAPPKKFEKLGHVSGTASGSLFILGTHTNFIPIVLNSRVARAYNNAIESVPGTTGLMDVTMKEYWVWWIIGSTRSVTITGEAIREVPE
jgi:hypothetical protein